MAQVLPHSAVMGAGVVLHSSSFAVFRSILCCACMQDFAQAPCWTLACHSVSFSIFSSKIHWHEEKFLYILPKTLARIKGARHCLAMVKSKGERESFVHEPFASQDSPARSHSCSLSLGMDRLFLMESSVPSVSKLVLVFAASWDGLRETVCLDLI